MSVEARELERQLDEMREKLKQAEARADEAEKRAQENLDRWQRAQADLANFRRRSQFDREEINVYHDGIVALLDQPEFARTERARAIVEVLERPQTLRELFPVVPANDGIQILIGSENRWDWMKECAFVLARYGAAGNLTGVVGVIGPLRLSYSVAVPAVRYVSKIMTELLGENGVG